MDIRNLAIIAHVDHGKTTLVDGMLKQTHTFRDNQAEMVQTTILDSKDLEREKGITILAKNTSVNYRGIKINIIDTPGHADFSGEVERVINMADGALLIVDAAEGPLPQTQFVLEKAFESNLKIIVLINKIDRKDAVIEQTLHATEELFLRLALDPSHLDFPVLYGIGREGKVWDKLPDSVHDDGNLEPLFEKIVSFVPAPAYRTDLPFMMQVSTLDFDNFKGTYAIGKVRQGSVCKNQVLAVYEHEKKAGQFMVKNIYTSIGLSRSEEDKSTPGDIIAITGYLDVRIGQTLVNPEVTAGLPDIRIGEPTIKINISPNSSPFAGREGKFSTARQLEERLLRERKTNIGLKIDKSNMSGFEVSGRGELHLAVLVEDLRREGYEMQIGKPQVIEKKIDGRDMEPFEEVTINTDQKYMGAVIESLGSRKGEMLDSQTNDAGLVKITYRASTRNLLGLRSELLTNTRGNCAISSRFIGYFPLVPVIPKKRNGVLVSLETGTSSGYALTTVQDRGFAFIGPGVPVYEGMIIGLNRRQEDIEINVCKTKKLTNIHSATADVAIVLDQPLVLSLEQSLDFIDDDELLEVTPENLRLRKRFLSKTDRIRSIRNRG